jgi:IMP cyclohydrolase (EC 3.5.4.10)/phosphoribosylaminoimidazolecarboxamide formyltransferase (EC 2.1.2.3)
LQTDTASSFGGIIIFNEKLDLEAAQELDKLFSEIVIAPDFNDDALEFLKHKKNRRLVKCRFGREKSELRQVAGGYLYQEKDNMIYNDDELKVVTKSQPDEKMLKDARFAYKIVKAVKSNAVVFVKDNATSGIGGGQPSRVDSTKIAVLKAKNAGIDLKGTVAASDAYFPFADGLLQVAEAGAVCVVQPGGSVRDQEVIIAADENKLVMIFTGYRHFKH